MGLPGDDALAVSADARYCCDRAGEGGFCGLLRTKKGDPSACWSLWSFRSMRLIEAMVD